MKIIGRLHVFLLFAALCSSGSAVIAASTGDLLQQALYAEEVDGNLQSAIKTYDQVIKNSAAPPNHVAQALYRQAMCYMKLKDEASARADLQKLVAEHADQTDIVEKARASLDELTDFDPAALMPPETLAYVEFGSPGQQVETILNMLKGTPFENPLAAVGGRPPASSNQRSPGDMIGALLNPSMMAEFKKIRSSAIGITGIAPNTPSIAVLYPGKSDALRGLILAALGVAGKPGAPIEGMQTVNIEIPNAHTSLAVAYDDRVIISAQPASQLEWCVKHYKGVSSEPTLASSNKSFARVSKLQRQKNVMTLWANVDAAYDQLLKVFPDGQLPRAIAAANAVLDFSNIDDLVITHSVEPNGLGNRSEIHFKDGNHCLAYDLIRTPNINKAALEAVPSGAVAIASFSLNQTDSTQAEKVRSQIQNMTGLDIGRELFANVQQITLFVMPNEDSSGKDAFLPGQLGLAITSHDPAKTKQVLTTVLGTASLVSGQKQSNAAGQYRIGSNGSRELFCYLDQLNGTTLLSLNRGIIDASMAALKNHSSISAAGPLHESLSQLPSNASKLVLVNLGGAIRLLGPQALRGTLSDVQSGQLVESLDQLAQAASATTIELRTDEQLDTFTMNSSVKGIPPLNQVIGPATQIAALVRTAKAEAAAKELRSEAAATIMPTTKPPAIDGNMDDAWTNAPSYKLENVLTSFGSGEKPSALSSPDDLAANFRAMWDNENLYLLVDVTDDKLVADTDPNHPVTLPSGSTTTPWWYDDSVEIYIDGDNAKAQQYGKNDAQIRINWSPTKPTMRCYNQNVETALPGVEFAMVKTDKGYRTEVKLPWSAFAVKPKAGVRIGLDVHVNDDDNGGERDKKITWHDTSDIAWESPRAFGNAELAGLISSFKFDDTEGTTAKDNSGNNHNGTLVGKAKRASGKHGGAIDLDGHGSFVQIDGKSAFDFGGQMTVACWINLRSVPAEWTSIVTKGDSAWRLSTLRQEPKLHFAVGRFQTDGEQVTVDGTTVLNSNEWHHVAGVYDGKLIKLYVDGKLDANKPWDGGIGKNAADVLIGENIEEPNRCFDGMIGDVRIYNCSLSEAEIKALAAAK